MIISNTVKCNNCEELIDWYYQIPQKVQHNRILDVDVIPKNKSGIKKCIHNEDNKYTLTCYCLKCGTSNTFEYESEYKLHLD